MAESLSEVSLSEMSASLTKLSLQVSSCRNSGEGACKVCPTLLRLFCETCGSGKSVKNSVSAKIRRVELLDAAGRSMLNCAPNEIEFLEGGRL